MIDSDTIAKCRDDVELFARLLVGQPLWKHQAKIARSTARIRVICSGRQAGKSVTLAVLALHDAFSAPDRRVLVLSAGEEAARELLSLCSQLASGPLLAGSVVDDNTSTIRLSNGSVVRSVPASQRQVRGRSVDLLILDEACFIDGELWTAAKFTVIARPESRVVMASTPWGRQDRFFAVAYRAGQRHVDGYESFHWPSTASPLVDRELLRLWRETSSVREYRAEVLAEWVDDSGAYFSSAELEAATVDVDLPELATAQGLTLDVGVDWGRRRDATAVVGVGLLPSEHPVVGERGPVRCPLWLEEWFRTPFYVAIGRIVDAATHPSGVRLARVVSEQNGIGEMPTEQLRHVLTQRGAVESVDGVFTDARNKESGFGAMRVLMQQGRLVLPRHPALLQQLAALEFEQTDGGTTRIAVPERAGHDDLAMAFQLALRPTVGDAREWEQRQGLMVGHYTRFGRGGAPIVWEQPDQVDAVAGRLMLDRSSEVSAGYAQVLARRLLGYGRMGRRRR